MLKDSRSSIIRKKFIDFFTQRGHEFYESSSLIPNNDKSLLWINSGIAALKKEFSQPNNKKKIVSCQKCVRTNDIENVGVTSRHHTFFEMLGNFSISEYFRKEAIDLAWEFLTSKDWLFINPTKLYVTVFPDDKKTYEYWKTKLPSENIFPCEENFWEIGEGPCGPCTEIFYDRGISYENKKNTQKSYPGGDNERYIEIWNIVFSQYYSKKGLTRDKYPEIPNKNIDTGMGLERICCILQNVEDNFSTDLFLPIIKKLEKISNKRYTKQDKDNYLSFRIIADHIRALVFMISDGALPTNDSNGYVIKKLLRRAVVEGRKLGINKIFLHTMVEVVVDTMCNFYKLENISFIQETISCEEKKFYDTLYAATNKLESIIKPIKHVIEPLNKVSKELKGVLSLQISTRSIDGLNPLKDAIAPLDKINTELKQVLSSQVSTEYIEILNNVSQILEDLQKRQEELDVFSRNLSPAKEVIKQVSKSVQSVLSHDLTCRKEFSKKVNNLSKIIRPILIGKEVFKLYDTFGLPLYITKMLASQYNIGIDEEGFNICMKSQINRSKKDNIVKKEDYTFYSDDNFINETLLKNVHNTLFVGYETLILKSQYPVLILNQHNEKVERLDEGQKGIVVFNKTTFYPQGGGQESDCGELISNENIIYVNKATMYLNIVLHHIIVNKGSISIKENYDLIVNKERRFIHSCAHTATHLLNLSLRKLLPCNIKQAGSKISMEKLSFDFTYSKPLKKEEIASIEDSVNSYILKNIHVSSINTSLEEANKMKVIGIFEDKYKKLDSVRVVIIGESKELCGGTHVKNTSEIGIFKIIAQKSVSSGVRRIEAIVNKNALNFLMKRSRILDDVKNNFRIKNDTLISEYIQKKNHDFNYIEKQGEQLCFKLINELFKNASVNTLQAISYKFVVIDFNINIGIIKKALLNISKKFVNVDILLMYVKDENNKRNFILMHTSNSSIDLRKILNNLKLLDNIKGGGNKQFVQLQIDSTLKMDNFLVLLQQAIKEY